MIITTTPMIEGRPVTAYLGVVAGEVILGANIFRDLFAGIRDIIGGRSGSYEDVLRQARTTAFEEIQQNAQRLGADAVIGVSVFYETVGEGRMLMVSCTGTAVKL